ncbi:hypothetical protein [Nevskia sp.]|uniref:hypothetical protein n=1 Tax=Nevskia sp. TaxID=1929292 RepID=UPI0025FE855D|nr:hypothetical protein [Nevskia sp.]
MRTLTLTAAAALILLLSACSGDKSPQAAPAAAPSEGGTSLSIDAKDGAVSFESDNGKNSTSISVGGDGDKKEEKKPD